MKKILTLGTVLVLAFAAAITLAACGKSGKSNSAGTGAGARGGANTGTRYVYTMPKWGYLYTFKFESGEPAASGKGTAYYEAGANNVSCPFTYTTSGATLTITWPADIGAYPEDLTKATPQQSVVAAFNVYANGDFSRAEVTNLAKPREFTITDGNIVGTTSTTIFDVTTVQEFVFEKKD